MAAQENVRFCADHRRVSGAVCVAPVVHAGRAAALNCCVLWFVYEEVCSRLLMDDAMAGIKRAFRVS